MAASVRVKPLDALEAGDGGGRAETRHVCGGTAVGDTCHQRRLGADDHQVGLRFGAGSVGQHVDGVAASSAGPRDGRLAATEPMTITVHDSTPSKLSLAGASLTAIG